MVVALPLKPAVSAAAAIVAATGASSAVASAPAFRSAPTKATSVPPFGRAKAENSIFAVSLIGTPRIGDESARRASLRGPVIGGFAVPVNKAAHLPCAEAAAS